jgi:putative DNA primase/helicase
MLISAGEVGLADKIAEGGKQPKAGQLVRLVDVPADAGRGYGLFEDTKGQSPASFAEAIKAAALAHYGHAGPMFVEALADDPAGVAAAARRLISERKQRLLAGLQAVDGQVERVAQRFALIATAGTLAQQCLHLPWADDEADRAAAICFRAWLTTRGEGPGELLAALQAIREAVEKHGEGRFRNLDREENGLDGFSQRAMRELLGYRRTRDGELLWCFTSAGLREVVGSLGQLASVVRMLAEREVLVTGSDRAHRLSLKVEGHTVQTYAVRQGALEAGGLP